MDAILIGWVECGLSRRQGKDEPAMTSIHGFEPENVAEEYSVCCGVLTVDHNMSTRNHFVPPQEQLKNSRARLFLSTSLRVHLHSQLPGRSQRARQYILARRREAYVGMSHPSKAARYRQENLRHVLDKRCLLLRRKHQISVALSLRSQ